MELLLQQGLPHQQKAIDAISKVFDGVKINKALQFYENPIIDLSDSKLNINIKDIQKDINPEYRLPVKTTKYLNLDVKMETGTGKTYVYVKTIYELNKRYGINKFIIIVPSLAIKAGTGQFLLDDYVSRHFKDACGYGKDIEVGILESPKKIKKGRTYFPYEVSEFVKGSCQDTKKIYVLLTNMQLLTNAKLLSKDNYDYGPEGFYRPFDAIRATHPFVIIDEPHRFSREQKAFKVIEDEIQPQCIIRFGATFPENIIGKGKNRVVEKDYQNLLYDLDACKSFNQGLIKGVAKEHFEPVSKKEEKVKITSIDSKETVHLQYKKKGEQPKNYSLHCNDSLAIISDAFEGLTVSVIDKSFVQFSNGITKTVGEELDVDIYMTSYQEQLLKLALQRHFETEKINFCNRTFKIKTLALFFIDDISSYRVVDGKKPYLLEIFEKLLKETIESQLKSLSSYESEYRNYLEASLNNISDCHGGYFSQDNNDSDDEIALEVNEILNGKKELLSFKKSDGSYNVRRFLFSKWTLKEGWDNPNVFTIAKLRSSGSENSKLQEVGRGLRLPVDENGNRISNEEFMLNYIVDFTEADFAQKLVNQINSEVPHALVISEEKLTEVAKKLGKTSDDLFDELYDKHYIDRHNNIKIEKRDEFFIEYPDFAVGLSSGKIKDRNKQDFKKIRIRKAVYNEIKDLWTAINTKYFLFYDQILNEEIGDIVLSIFEKNGVFSKVSIKSDRIMVKSDGESMRLETSTGVEYIVNHPVTYGEFLKRISNATNLPVRTLHKSLCVYSQRHGLIERELINESTIASFCKEFFDWKIQNLQGRFKYKKSNCPVESTSLSYADGKPRLEIAQGRIGTKIIEGTPCSKYLYDSFAFDSPLEKTNITTDIEEVVVYGKIPRNSIAIPTISGGTYSPDFMYVVKKTNGEKELNVIVETKDVEGKIELRGTEESKIKCAEVFFNTLKEDGFDVKFRTQLGNKQMKQIIQNLLD